MQVFRVAISPQSLFNRAFKPVDYADAWQVSIQSKKDIQVEDVLLAFQPPVWVAWLLRLRDTIVGFFGLKKVNATRGKQSIATLKEGDSLGFFKVFGRSDQELLLGADDSHLDFRVSFSLADQINSPRILNYLTTSNEQLTHTERSFLLTCATGVHYNNRWGKLYLRRM